MSWGADEIVHLDGENVEADVAHARSSTLMQTELPAIILAPSTAWGREVASRVAARLGAGLTGDAVELEVDDDFRLTAWKPAFGGQLVAAIGCTSLPQIATVRAGVLPTLTPARRAARVDARDDRARRASGRVRVLARTRDDDLDVLGEAQAVIGVGMGVPPDALRRARTAAHACSAPSSAATRKVTDKGWLPRARQVGITGRAIAPRLFVSIGASGKFNHIVGVRAARTRPRDQPRPERAGVRRTPTSASSATGSDAVPLLVGAARASATSRARAWAAARTRRAASPRRRRRRRARSTRLHQLLGAVVDRVVERPLARTEARDRDQRRDQVHEVLPALGRAPEHEEPGVQVVGDERDEHHAHDRARRQRREQAEHERGARRELGDAREPRVQPCPASSRGSRTSRPVPAILPPR